MSTFVTYTIAFWAGFIISYILFKQAQRFKRNNTEVQAETEQSPRSLEQETRVMELFESQIKIRNDDVQKLLNVSDATATRVLDRLEQTGKIAAHGKTKNTFYTQK